jgi:hypothetical protein
MLKNACFLVIILVLSGCRENQFKKIDFEVDGFSHEKYPVYKLTKFIQDSILRNMEYGEIGDLASIGNMPAMLALVDSIGTRHQEELSKTQVENFKNYTIHEAIDYILSNSKNEKIIIINEAHHMPQHRVFSTKLLKGLYDQGYRHLGLETLSTNGIDDSILNIQKYPTLTSGFYTREPQFGNFVREALIMGWKVFGYESDDLSSGKIREENQAKNIKSYMNKYPDGKFFIHCGFDHALEGNIGGEWEKTMAGRLTEYTGVNPLTIDQVKYSESSKKIYENGYYQLTNLQESSVLLDSNNKIFDENRDGMWKDIHVFHPRTKNFDRPQWLIFDNRKEYNIDLTSCDLACPCLVFAYLDGEKIGSAVPYDLQETVDKKVKLILKPGNYHLVIWNQKDSAQTLVYNTNLEK